MTEEFDALVNDANEMTDIIRDCQDSFDPIILKSGRLQAFADFALYDPLLRKTTEPDEILLNGRKISFTKSYEPSMVIRYKKDPAPFEYELTVKKAWHKDIIVKLKSGFSTSTPELHHIGQLDLTRRAKAFGAVLTWGNIPLDLDFHVWSFKDLTQVEHVFYKAKKSDVSYIALDVDIRRAFGPETIVVNNLSDNDMWWLVSVHNYSYWKHNDQNDAHMNSGETKVKLLTGDGESFIEPSGDFNGYWWDVMLVHAGNVYILNRYNSTRDGDFNKEFSRSELRRLINEVSQGWDDIRPI